MKTTFRRQVTLIIGLLLTVTVVVGISFYALFNRYVTSEQEDSLRTAAQSVSDFSGAYQAEGNLYIGWDFRTSLSLASRAAGNDILLCATDGTVLICAQDIQGCAHIGKSLGAATAAMVCESASADVGERASAIYGSERLAVAVPVKNFVGEPICIVVASMEKNEIVSLTRGTLRIFTLTALVVCLLATLLIPRLTRRETEPILSMSQAARQLARGNYDARVPTGYRIEEVEELAIAFNNMAASMQRAENTRHEFVANISHELRTPMTTIAGYIDGILDGTIPPEKHRAYLDLASAETRRLSRIVRSMLDISRLKDQGIPDSQIKRFNICELAGQALLSFEQRINRKNLQVIIEMPELGLTVAAHQDYVTQVLYNLLDNAVKFVDADGTLAIRISAQGGKVLTTIENSGPTIAPEELPMIFDRFHKTDKSRSGDRDGVGLGLYIVKTIVLAHGEDIHVTSQNGKTAFTFTMPLSE